MAHTPLKMSIDEAHNEVRIGWSSSYSPEAIEKVVDSLNHKPLGYRINILIARLCFRGIYFPQMGRFAWLKSILENRRIIFKLIRQGFGGGLRAGVASVATLRARGSSPEASAFSSEDCSRGRPRRELDTQ
jgi:hypothetical protein